jgi:hypothetical protein
MPELDPTLEENVTKGSLVEIDISDDPERLEAVSGIIKKIVKIDDNGIIVELESGKTGYVEEIIRFVQPTTIENSDLKKIKNDEWDSLELKESFTFDCKRYRHSDDKAERKELQWNIPKTISGFGNKIGGKLYVGVNDDRKIVGLKFDYEIMGVNSDDFVQRIKGYIKKSFATFVVDESSGRKTTIPNEGIWDAIESIRIIKFNRNEHGEQFADEVTEDEVDVLRINVKPSDFPCICYKESKLTENQREYSMPIFYVRQANTTEPLSAKDFINYWLEHKN